MSRILKTLFPTLFQGAINAIYWNRTLTGDFEEIVNKVKLNENIMLLEPEELHQLQLSEHGQLAREILLNDLKLLQAHGAAPIFNLIRCYERDETSPFFPTELYSFHVDRSPYNCCIFEQVRFNSNTIKIKGCNELFL